MPKSPQPIEWSVGEEQFAQISAAEAQQKKHELAASAQGRSRPDFFQILSGLAIAAAIYMGATYYFSVPESASVEEPEQSSLTVSTQEPGKQAEGSALKEQAIQDILALEISMALGPKLYTLVDAQSLANHDRPLVDSIKRKVNGGEADPAILGLQRREFLLDIQIAEPLAIATILVENPNDEQWQFGSYQEKRFYQREGASWRWADPKDQFIEPPQWLETESLRFEFQELERTHFLAIAAEMEAAHARLLKILSPSYSGREFRPSEPPQSLSRSDTSLDESKVTLVSVPRDVPGMIGAGQRQKIASLLVSKRPTSFSDEAWLAQKVFERLVHLQVRESVATEVGIGYHRWDQMGAALNGWLQYEILGRRSPWHAEAAANFEPSIYTDEPQPLAVLFTTDPNGWPSRGEQMEEYMLAETMIDYAVQTHGIGTVGNLLHGFSVYNRWADLIPAVYGVPVGEFEEGWNEYLRNLPEKLSVGGWTKYRANQYTSGCASNNCLNQGTPTQSFLDRGEESWPKQDRE